VFSKPLGVRITSIPNQNKKKNNINIILEIKIKK